MGKCDFCGNVYDKSFTVTTSQGETFTFDSFECAIHRLAPTCANCGVRIIGHGFEANNTFFCSDHCGRQQGVMAFEDNV